MNNIEKILSSCDHTLLDRCAKEDEIKRICDEGIKYGVFSVCIPPCYVNTAKNHIKDRLKICTVIGFPNGYSSTEAKAFEAKTAVNDGADEIDMVINLGMVKDGKFDDVHSEINTVKHAIGKKVLKVIIETCYLTNEEKIKLCEVVSDSDADFIKTSTGFGTGGATVADIELMAKHIKNGKKIKAAGGISTLEDAEAFLSAGAARLGTSKIVKLVKNEFADGY